MVNLEQQVINVSFQAINQINKELQNNNIINLNYLLLKMSTILSKDVSIPKNELEKIIISEVNKLLIKYSATFKEILDNRKFVDIYIFINKYMIKVLKYYDELMMTNQEKFDRYVEITNGHMPNDKIKKSENLFISMDDIQNTMKLLNEAVRNYYEIYYNKTLFATFTNEKIIQFKLMEGQLAHLLGINFYRIISDQKYIDLFQITPKEIEFLNDRNLDPLGKAKISILQKIVDISNGNLLQFEEDRLKKIKNYNYQYIDYGADDKNLFNYAKMNMKSKSFINFKPLEELSLVLDFPQGYELIESHKKNVEKGNEKPAQHSVLFSKNNLSEQFKYSTLITNYDKDEDRRYFMSLFVKKPEEFEQLQKESIPSITTSVELASDDGSVGSVKKVFSTSEQIEFLKDVYNDFKKLDLSEIVNYFQNLIDECGYTKRKGK